ncbi:MAG: PQQ-binding-like beta-propeller repeat protein [Alphaproteobacteria bacterium]|nr:PQQ-binding-like beta-propeller repeat protein [Alphaproteobacteria bacterium]
MELEKKLTPDDAALIGNGVVIPDSWQNDFWPQTGGYPGHTMQNLALAGNSLKQIWSLDIGSGGSDELPLTAPPIIAENTIVTLDTKQRLAAFNAGTGKKIWQTDVMAEDEDEAVITGGVAYEGGKLFVTNGFDELLSVSLKDGKIIWRRPLPAPSRAAPTVLNKRIFVSTLDNRVVAFDAATGNSLWDYTGISEMAGLLGTASPAADDDIVVAAFSSGEITALRVENGSVAWSDNLASVRNYGGGLESLSDIRALPVLNGGLVIGMSFSGKLAAIEEQTGMRVWQREISGSETPWAAGENLFVLSTENQLIALNRANGAIIWITELPRYENPEKKKDPISWSGPVMGSNKLYLAGDNGIMLKIDAIKGKIEDHIKIRKNVRMRPLIAQKTMYLLSEDGTLSAYR